MGSVVEQSGKNDFICSPSTSRATQQICTSLHSYRSLPDVLRTSPTQLGEDRLSEFDHTGDDLPSSPSSGKCWILSLRPAGPHNQFNIIFSLCRSCFFFVCVQLAITVTKTFLRFMYELRDGRFAPAGQGTCHFGQSCKVTSGAVENWDSL